MVLSIKNKTVQTSRCWEILQKRSVTKCLTFILYVYKEFYAPAPWEYVLDTNLFTELTKFFTVKILADSWRCTPSSIFWDTKFSDFSVNIINIYCRSTASFYRGHEDFCGVFPQVSAIFIIVLGISFTSFHLYFLKFNLFRRK